MDPIFENVKMAEEGSSPTSVSIVLNFPYSVGEFRGGYGNNSMVLKRQFILSFNEALNSEFLKHMLEDFPENVSYCEITIPRGLYWGMRLFDINCLYELWTGRMTITHAFIHEEIYHLKDISKLSDALLLSKELPFMHQLHEKYSYRHDYN